MMQIMKIGRSVITFPFSSPFFFVIACLALLQSLQNEFHAAAPLPRRG
jgi:hypothetical protein